MSLSRDRLASTLARFHRGELSAGMALAQLLLLQPDVNTLRPALQAEGALALLQVLDATEAGAAQAAAIITDHPEDLDDAADVAEAIERLRALFDGAVRVNAAASVALYSLGDERLLAEATAEAVELMASLGVVATDRHLLDIGCGIGRFEQALAGRVASITGIDVSAAMILAARQRCAGLANVRLLQSTGQGLAAFTDAAFDAVIAVDSFPYLYLAGGAGFARDQLAEVARVLRPGGDLLILNLSYRGDLARDRADAQAFAMALGFELRCNGISDLRSWDGRTFHLRRAGL